MRQRKERVRKKDREGEGIEGVGEAETNDASSGEA